MKDSERLGVKPRSGLRKRSDVCRQQTISSVAGNALMFAGSSSWSEPLRYHITADKMPLRTVPTDACAAVQALYTL